MPVRYTQEKNKPINYFFVNHVFCEKWITCHSCLRFCPGFRVYRLASRLSTLDKMYPTLECYLFLGMHRGDYQKQVYRSWNLFDSVQNEAEVVERWWIIYHKIKLIAWCGSKIYFWKYESEKLKNYDIEIIKFMLTYFSCTIWLPSPLKTVLKKPCI